MDLADKINKRLAQHIEELERFGNLPHQWWWSKDKVIELEKIDERLIDDLIALHDLHHGIGDTLPNLLPSLKELHTDLQAMLEMHQAPEGHDPKITYVNRLLESIKIILDQHKSYGHLTPEEQRRYLEMFREDVKLQAEIYAKWKASGRQGPEPPKVHRAYRYLKDLWNKRVDRKFIQSVKTVHWVDVYRKLPFLLEKVDRKHELSAMAYLDFPFLDQWGLGIGAQIKGWVTWGAVGDARSDNRPVDKNDPRYVGQKYSYGDNVNVILNAKSFSTPKHRGESHNEFVVDNWKPVDIVIDKEKLKEKFDWQSKDEGRFLLDTFSATTMDELMNHIAELAKKHNLNVIDHNGNILFNHKKPEDSEIKVLGIKTLKRIIESGDVEKIRAISENGQLSKLIPEWERLKSDDTGWQHSFHQFRLDEHTFRLYQYLSNDPDLGKMRAYYRKMLNIAILVHDIGKQGGAVGEIHSLWPHPEHPQVSAEFAVGILQRLNYNPQDIDYITKIVKYHDALGNLAVYGEGHPKTKFTMKDLRESFKKGLGTNITLLKILTKADITSIKQQNLLTGTSNYFTGISRSNGGQPITTDMALDYVAELIIRGIDLQPTNVVRFSKNIRMELYHTTYTGENNETLESFYSQGIKSKIAQGYGQGQGFYVWTNLERAKKHVDFIRNNDPARAKGYPLIVVLNEIINPLDWDVDYEVQKQGILKFLHDNFDYLQKIPDGAIIDDYGRLICPSQFNKHKDGIQFVFRRADGGISYLGFSLHSEGDMQQAAILGKILSYMQKAFPELVYESEVKFFGERGKDTAIKYTGKMLLRPSKFLVLVNGEWIDGLQFIRKKAA